MLLSWGSWKSQGACVEVYVDCWRFPSFLINSQTTQRYSSGSRSSFFLNDEVSISSRHDKRADPWGPCPDENWSTNQRYPPRSISFGYVQSSKMYLSNGHRIQQAAWAILWSWCGKIIAVALPVEVDDIKHILFTFLYPVNTWCIWIKEVFAQNISKP